LSAADGHSTRGAFAFFIGAASAGQAVPLNPTAADAGALPLPSEVVVRWLNLLTALALCGALTLNVLMGDAGDDFAAIRAAMARRLRVWIVVNLLVLFVGTIVSQLLQAAAASESSLGDVLAQSIWLQTLTRTRFGQAGLARIVLVDVLLVLFAASGSPDRGRIRWLWNARALDVLYAAFAALILFTFSLGSHAAAANDTLKLALIADGLHLLAIGAWMGGLFVLALVLSPQADTPIADDRLPTVDVHSLPAISRPLSTVTAFTPVLLIILRRFSNLAVVSVAAFALTGLYSAWRQVGYVNALVGTPYGITLMLKSVVIVPVLLMGLINTLALRPDLVKMLQGIRWLSGRSPRVRRGWVVRWFVPTTQPPNHLTTVLRFVRLEAALGAFVVLAAATLTALPPARTAVAPPLPPPFVMTRQASDAKVALSVDPYVVGNQTFVVKIADLQGNPLPNVTRVTLRFTFLGADLGTAAQEMQPVSVGAYKLEGGYLSVVGAWKVETLVRRKDVEDDLRVPFRLNVTDPVSSRGEELPALSSGFVFAIFDLIAGFALLMVARRKHMTEGKWIGVGALALGVVLLLMSTVFATPTSAGIATNPIVPDESSLAKGKAIYDDNCSVCHGPLGRGNGPLAASLNPRPADFALHINFHSDEVLFNWISKGIPGTAMQAWEDKLTETERWHTLNYIQALVERATAPTPTK
ncbi:MAG: CopD family protein, partial [Chloroflexota bacterium]